MKQKIVIMILYFVMLICCVCLSNAPFVLTLKSFTLIGAHQVTSQGFIVFISKCIHLTTINLTDNIQLNNNVIECLVQNCQKLKEIEVGLCENLTDECLVYIAQYLPNLLFFECSYCNFTVNGLEMLKQS